MTKREFVVLEYKKNHNVNRTHLAVKVGFSRKHVIRIIKDYIENPNGFQLKTGEQISLGRVRNNGELPDFIEHQKHQAIQKLKDLRALIDQQINELESC